MFEPLLTVGKFMLEILSDPLTLAFMLCGSFVGTIFGAIPGITATTAVVLLIPITYHMPLDLALVTLLSIFKGGMFGGSISSILLGIPGSPGAVATRIDGYPMGQAGKGRKATLMALFASVTGDSLSDIFTIIVAPVIGLLAMKIGPPELFLIIIVCLFLIGTMSGSLAEKETRISNFSKAAISGLLGLTVIFIGMEPIIGTPRFTFGIFELLSGLPLVPVFLGLFGFSTALKLLSEQSDTSVLKKVHLPPPKNPEDGKCTLKEYFYCLKSILFGTVIGAGIGMAPGLGPNAAGLIAHANGRMIAKDQKGYGKGTLEGVAIAESANSAVYGANLLPLVTIGIPGSAEAAVLMGAFLLHGIQLGPLLIINQPDVIYKMFGGMLLANLCTLAIGYFCISIFVKAITIPRNILFPIVMILCLIGPFSEQPRLMYLWVAIAFGVIGYLMDKVGLSVAALCIGYILGNYAESAFNQSVIIAKGKALNILGRPAFLITFALLAFLFIIVQMNSNKKRRNVLK